MFIMYKSFFIFILFLFVPFRISMANDFAYSDEWLKLLHYQKMSNNEYQGLVENEDFYLNENGRNNPQIEFDTAVEYFSQNKRKCDFPARFNLLKKYGFISGDLEDCIEYRQFIEDIQPNGITLIFTSAYMSNPASLFGHTLIRVDTKRKGSQMLAHGANFGANSGAETGVTFILKGLFGGYMGVYSINPYWDIINTYNNIENRDIWEYKLNLTHEEEIKFVNHLYELKNAQIKYFFLTKNCSYMLLELLEAVRPSLELTDNHPIWAIPLDTLKTVNSISNLIENANYRPSRYTKIKNLIDNMDNQQYQAFLKGIKDYDYSIKLSDEKYSDVLEAQYQYFQYKYIMKDIELKEYRKNSFEVLRKRSAMPQAHERIIKGENPIHSHNSSQISLAVGSHNGKTFEEIQLRPTYTSLTDSTYGLVKGAEIEVLNSKWRYLNQSHKFLLNELSLINIKSLVESNRTFSPVSYSTYLGIKRKINLQTSKEGYVGNLNIGIGRTYNFFDYVWIYGMLKIGGEYGGFIPGNQWGGFIPELGVYKDFGKVRLHYIFENSWATRNFGNILSNKFMLSWGFGYNFSLDAFYRNSKSSEFTDEEFSLGIKYSF